VHLNSGTSMHWARRARTLLHRSRTRSPVHFKNDVASCVTRARANSSPRQRNATSAGLSTATSASGSLPRVLNVVRPPRKLSAFSAV
jgi:hypothetical protein